MSYQVLARKWRPRDFSEVVGQTHVVQALVNGLDQDRLHHAFLLTGTRGVGKTTLARVLAKCLNCEQGVSSTPCGECGACMDIDEGRFVDLLEVDAASKTKVDDTRDMLDNVQYAPTRGRYKVYLIDEVHMLSTHSFNALLKTLEEPPPHVKFILATTDPQRIPVTILSRCLRFNLKRLLPEEIERYLSQVLSSEDIEFESAALAEIALAADGSMRDALSLLDQAISFGGGRVLPDDVQQMLGTIDQTHLQTLLAAIADGDTQALLKSVEELSALAVDFDRLLARLAEAFHRMTLIQAEPDFRDASRADWSSLATLAERFAPADLQLFYHIVTQGRADLNLAPDPRTGIEMILLRLVVFRPLPAAGDDTPAPEPDPNPAPDLASTSTPNSTRGARSAAKTASQASTPAAAPRQASAARREAAAIVQDTVSSSVASEGGDRHVSKPADNMASGSSATESRAAKSPAPDRPADSHSATALPPANPATATSRSTPAPEPPAKSLAPAPNGVAEPPAGEAAWPDILVRLGLRGGARELARHLEFEGREDNIWRFRVSQDVAGFNTPRHVEQLKRALSDHIHAPQEVRIEVTGATRVTPAAAEAQASAERLREAERAIAQDPTVRDLQEHMGARILPGSVRPAE